MDEVAAVSEPGEGSKCRPGEEIVHRTSTALACGSTHSLMGLIATLVQENMTQAREKAQASL